MTRSALHTQLNDATSTGLDVGCTADNSQNDSLLGPSHKDIRILRTHSSSGSSESNNLGSTTGSSQRGVRARYSFQGGQKKKDRSWDRYHSNSSSYIPPIIPTPSPRQRRSVTAPLAGYYQHAPQQQQMQEVSRLSNSNIRTNDGDIIYDETAKTMSMTKPYVPNVKATLFSDLLLNQLSTLQTRQSFDYSSDRSDGTIFLSNDDSRVCHTLTLQSSTSVSSNDDNDEEDKESRVGYNIPHYQDNGSHSYRSAALLKKVSAPLTNTSSRSIYAGAHEDAASQRQNSHGVQAHAMASQSNESSSHFNDSPTNPCSTTNDSNNHNLYHHRQNDSIHPEITTFAITILHDIRRKCMNMYYYGNICYRIWIENRFLLTTIVAWYTIGVIAIVTTKILVKEWSVPPLVLTTQQLAMGSLILRIVLQHTSASKNSLQPWPWHSSSQHSNDIDKTTEVMKPSSLSREGVMVDEQTIPSSTNSNNSNALIRRDVTYNNNASDIHQMDSGKGSTPNSCNADLIVLDNDSGHHDGDYVALKNDSMISTSVGTIITSTDTIHSTRQENEAKYHHHDHLLKSFFDYYWRIYQGNSNFILAGVFFSLDFAFSNTAFSLSDASFVETVKASDPICTTTIALLYQVDKLSVAEGGSLALLIIGVLLSTIGNSKGRTRLATPPIDIENNSSFLLPLDTTLSSWLNESIGNNLTSRMLLESEFGNTTSQYEDVIMETAGESAVLRDVSDHDQALWGSIYTATLVTTANLCFAFRAMNQKRYRFKTHEMHQMDDINLLCRMLHIGAIFLSIPTIILYGHLILQSIIPSSSFTLAQYQQHDTITNQITFTDQLTYVLIALVNAISYVTYNWASTFVLSKLTVLHHSSLNCLRRMFAIIATTIYFRVPMTIEAIMGLITSFLGFGAFTFYRNVRLQQITTATTGGGNSSNMSLLKQSSTAKDASV